MNQWKLTIAFFSASLFENIDVLKLDVLKLDVLELDRLLPKCKSF